MKNVYLVLLVTIGLLSASSLKSAEVIPVWNTTVEGKVQDMDFLKGQNEILMLLRGTTEDYIQRRNPENGELISSKVESISDFASFVLTPDSMRFVQINGIDASLRMFDENYTKIKTFSLQNIQEENIVVYLTSIAVDPIRPIAYVTTSGFDKTSSIKPARVKVIAYNYETGEHVKDLTPYGEDEYTALEVSHDGRYLATLNDNKAYLKVWDLETMELIINEPLFDVNNDDWCRAKDIYFSKIEENVIYISGNFTQKISSNDLGSGAYKYYMKNKTRELILPNEIYGSDKLIFIDNESRIINTNTGIIGVINLKENQLEYYKLPPENVFTTLVRYSNAGDYFIGASYNNRISKFIYDSQSNVENNYDDEIRISPNPTNGFVKINSNCSEPLINYNISDTNGILLIQSTMENNSNNLQFDFSPYPSGVYFLTINCNNQLETYKIIKEG
ncbi:MAG: T9SS type A sorting domain-containing protein [Ignavibacteriae bacterium]|nr:T9SS type A sorting domain-containing protein [Ignavibacteriota bacterium]